MHLRRAGMVSILIRATFMAPSFEAGQFDAECRPAGLAGWLVRKGHSRTAASPLRVDLIDQAS